MSEEIVLRAFEAYRTMRDHQSAAESARLRLIESLGTLSLAEKSRYSRMTTEWESHRPRTPIPVLKPESEKPWESQTIR